MIHYVAYVLDNPDDVGYLRSQLKYFPLCFACELDQNDPKMNQCRGLQALWNSIAFGIGSCQWSVDNNKKNQQTWHRIEVQRALIVVDG